MMRAHLARSSRICVRNCSGVLPIVVAPSPLTRLRMSLELSRNFAAISNEKHQEALSHMARVLAAQEQPQAMDGTR